MKDFTSAPPSPSSSSSTELLKLQDGHLSQETVEEHDTVGCTGGVWLFFRTLSSSFAKSVETSLLEWSMDGSANPTTPCKQKLK